MKKIKNAIILSSVALIAGCGDNVSDYSALGESGETGAPLQVEDAGLYELVLSDEEELEMFGHLATPGTEETVASVLKLESCEWEKSYGTGINVEATCESGMKIVSGGCYQSNSVSPSIKITRNGPYEWGDWQNQPEPGEWFHQVGGTQGWSCRRGSSSSARLYANALCCDFTLPE